MAGLIYMYMNEMNNKHEIAMRGLEVKVKSRLFFGPWHSVMYGVYTKDDVLLGYFNSCAEALEYALRCNHRIINILSVLLVIVDWNWRDRRCMRSLLENIFAGGPKQLNWKISGI